MSEPNYDGILKIRSLIERLRGNYTVPVNDGAGLLNGKSIACEIFPVPPINREAADLIAKLALALLDISEGSADETIRKRAKEALGL